MACPTLRHARYPRWNAVLALASALGLGACADLAGPPVPSQDDTSEAALDASAASAAQAAAQASPGQPIPGRWIVVFNQNTPDAPGLARQLAQDHGSAPTFVYSTALRGFAAPLSDQAVAALRRNPNVAYIEQDQVATAIGTQTGATWGLDRIDQRALPLDGSFTYDNDGAGVNAYILDTGIRTSHNEFAGRATFAVDFIGDGNENVNSGDCGGHGTHVAGTVGGSTYGVAKGVALYAVRVLDCGGSGSYSAVIGGIDWVAANHSAPAVANMSLGGGASSSLNQAVENAIAAGVTFAVAAGNENTNACNRSPASAPSALTVGASTSSDSRSSFSNFGTCLDLFAPGSAITSSTNGSDGSTGTWNGTSMATPHVAGAVALLLANDNSLSPSQITTLITQNATSGRLSGIGSGSPNLLLHSLLDGSPPPEDTPVHVGNISVSVDFGRKNANGTALVTILDDAGSPVGLGISVVGDWLVDGSVVKSGTSQVTNESGVASVTSGGMRRVTSSQNVEFCVTSVSGSGVVYNSDSNVVTCATDGGEPPPPPPPPGGFELTAQAIKGRSQVSLSWSGSSASSFDVLRNDFVIAGGVSGNSLTDDPPGGPWTYQVCEAGTSVCTNSEQVTTRR